MGGGAFSGISRRVRGVGLDVLNQLSFENLEGPVSVRLSQQASPRKAVSRVRLLTSRYTHEATVFGGWQVRQESATGDLSWEADVEAQDVLLGDGKIGGIGFSFGDSSSMGGRGDLEEVAFQHLVWPKGTLELTQEEGLSLRMELQDLAQKTWLAQGSWFSDQSSLLVEELRLSRWVVHGFCLGRVRWMLGTL